MASHFLEFWFEYGSTYSYLSVMRMESVARVAGVEVEVEWKPFLLMPIFKELGWRDSPFVQIPVKGEYMWRDLERRAQAHGLPYQRPSVFPPQTLLTARIGFLAFREGWGEDFTREVFRLHWTEDRIIGTPENLEPALHALGKEPEEVIAAAQAEEIKLGLRAQTEQAVAHGIFGAPSFVVGESKELFWGDDRLEEALEWAVFE